jgi:hypothetical protein
MDISFLRSSNREIKNMNKGKVGAPFEYSRTYILKVKPSVANLNPDNDDDSKPITLIVDASGLTITKKGDYIEQKWIR